MTDTIRNRCFYYEGQSIYVSGGCGLHYVQTDHISEPPGLMQLVEVKVMTNKDHAEKVVDEPMRVERWGVGTPHEGYRFIEETFRSASKSRISIVCDETGDSFVAPYFGWMQRYKVEGGKTMRPDRLRFTVDHDSALDGGKFRTTLIFSPLSEVK
jgi:hypothetical protein